MYCNQQSVCWLISGYPASLYVEAERMYLISLRLDPSRAIASEESVWCSLLLD